MTLVNLSQKQMIKVQQSPSTDRLITDHFRITGQWLRRI